MHTSAAGDESCRVHGQRDGRVQQGRAGGRGPVRELGGQLHLPVHHHPGRRPRLQDGHLLPVHQPGRHLRWYVGVCVCVCVCLCVCVCVCDQQLLEVDLMCCVCCLFSGATADTVLNGMNAKPDLFPEYSQGLPDINFFYRCSDRQRHRKFRFSGSFFMS